MAKKQDSYTLKVGARVYVVDDHGQPRDPYIWTIERVKFDDPGYINGVAFDLTRKDDSGKRYESSWGPGDLKLVYKPSK